MTPVERLFLTSAIFLFSICPGALAGPAKVYDDISVNNTNTDTITAYRPSALTYLSWDLHTGIELADSNPHAPGIFFYNTGDIHINDTGIIGSIFCVAGIGNDNETIGIENRGDISIDLSSADGRMVLFGLFTTGTVNNIADISITARGGTAGSIFTPADADAYGINSTGGAVTSSGDITVTARAGTGCSDSAYSSARASAYGIKSDGGAVISTGDITVTARGGYTAGSISASADAVGIRGSGSIQTDGLITVRAVAGRERPGSSSPFNNADATGVWITNTATLLSKGLIRVDAALSPGLTGGSLTARQVYVEKGTTTITGYAMEINTQTQTEFTAAYEGAVALGTDPTAAAVFSNATLYPVLGQNFSGETSYEIPMLVAGAAAGDQFTSMAALPVDYKGSLVSGNGLQKIKIDFAPKASTPLLSSRALNRFGAQGHDLVGASLLSNIVLPAMTPELGYLDRPEYLLASLDTPLDALPPRDKKKVAFATPVLLKSRDNSAIGYKAETVGLLGGHTRSIRDDLFTGFHLGVNTGEVKYTGTGYDRRSEEISTCSLGLHGVYIHDDRWLLTGIGSFFYSESDTLNTDPSNMESASYDAFSTRVDTTLGYLVRLGNQILLPEVGLAWAWNNREGFTTANQSNLDITYGAMDEHEIYAKLGLKWFANLQGIYGWTVRPTLCIGVTRAVTDAESSNTMGVGTFTQLITDYADRTTVTSEAGVTFARDRFEFSAGYSGGYSDNVRTDMFRLQAAIGF